MGATDRTLACPECGSPCSQGVKFCAECGIPLSSLDLDLGTVVGSYRLIEVVGEGGMGRVYVAEHVRLGRRVAIKKLRSELVSNPSAVARFFAEARAVNRISHDNIVEITDFVEQPGGDNYIIMELLRGEDLAHRLQRKRTLPLARAFDIAAQTASALAAVHAAGMIHRDLKPDNIFLIERGGSPDFVKVLDFGVAKLTASERGNVALHVTAAGQIIGTPEYMSPEQAGGVSVDFRTDIYALGVILYEMITGVLPFQAKSFGDLLLQHMTAPVQLPGASPGLPPSIHASRDQLLLDLLAKQPGDRPPSMGEVELRLRGLLDAMDLPQPPKRKSAQAERAASVHDRAEVTPILLPKRTTGAGAVARLALIKRQTPPAVVEITAPRSSSRIEIPTPDGVRIGSPTSQTGLPAGRLARASIDCLAGDVGTLTPDDGAPAVDEDATPVDLSREVWRSAARTEPGLPLAAPERATDRPQVSPVMDGRGTPPVGSAAEWQRGSIERRQTRVRGSGGEPPPSETPARITRPIVEVPSVEGLEAELNAEVAVDAKPPTRPSQVSIDASGESLRPPAASTSTVERVRAAPSRASRWLAVAGVLAAAVVAGFVVVELRSPDPVARPAAPAEVRIKFVSAPAGAIVRVAGTDEILGTTPFTQSFVRSDRPVAIELSKPGFEKVVEELPLTSDDAVAATLIPLASPPLPTAAPPSEEAAVAPPPAVVAPVVAPPLAAPPARPTVAPKPDRSRRPTSKPAAPTAATKPDRSLDRNGTLDVFKAP